MTQTGLMAFVATSEELDRAAEDVWQAFRDGHIRANIERLLPLREAANAHCAFESGQQTGATIFAI